MLIGYEDAFLLQLSKNSLKEQYWDDQDVEEAVQALEHVLHSLRCDSSKASFSFDEYIILKHLESQLKKCSCNR